MQQLLGDVTTMDRSILKGLFLRRLPTEVNMVLASAGDSLDINQLAAMADKIMEVSRPPVATLSAVSQSAPSTSTNSVDALHAEVRQLRDMDQSLTLQMAHRPRYQQDNFQRRDRSQNRYRSPSRGRSMDRKSIPGEPCWYHLTYGDKARNCKCVPLNDKASR
ncbi:Uncharacterised protein r2_g1419 [Pycnogonum litorale]